MAKYRYEIRRTEGEVLNLPQLFRQYHEESGMGDVARGTRNRKAVYAAEKDGETRERLSNGTRKWRPRPKFDA